MRKASIIFGFIFAILAVILAVLPLYKFAFIPAILAFVLGVLVFIKSKKEGLSTHTIQIIFLLTIIALGLATYKAVFSTTEVGDTEQLEQREKESEEKSIEELEDLDLDFE